MEMEDDVLRQALKDSGADLEVKDNSVNAISKLALKQLKLMAEVDAAEDALSRLKEDLKKVSEIDLPTAMLEAGMREFKLVDGASIKVEKFYGASIKVENRPEAYKWLVDNGHEGLIKTSVVTEFGKGVDERKEARKFMESVVKDGFSAELDESVHASTLKAFVKEQIEAKNELPASITTFVGDRAKIVLPKKK